MATRRLESFSAEVTGVVSPDERGNDKIASVESKHVRTNVFDDADKLVADALTMLRCSHRPVWPKVATADTRTDYPDESVGGLPNLRVRDGLDSDVSRTVDDRCSHENPFVCFR